MRYHLSVVKHVLRVSLSSSKHATSQPTPPTQTTNIITSARPGGRAHPHYHSNGNHTNPSPRPPTHSSVSVMTSPSCCQSCHHACCHGCCHCFGTGAAGGCVTLRQGCLLVSVVSVVFSLLVFAHEIALDGGFSLRNYVVLAFCIVWMVVTLLLVLGACKRAHFMLLPWMILTCMLMPLFIVGCVAGVKVIIDCDARVSQKSCTREYHIFGTNDTVVASIKVSVLIVMVLLHISCFFIVYKYFMQLSGSESRKRAQETDVPIYQDDQPSTVRYERFLDDEDPETNVPLCDSLYDTKETLT